MNITSFTETVGERIGKDDLKGAISMLHKLLKDSPKLDAVILQSARLTDIQKQIRNGIVTFDEASISKNKIRMALLSLCSEIEEYVLQDAALQEEIKQKKQEGYRPNIQQTHHGTGDNVGGDKIVNA